MGFPTAANLDKNIRGKKNKSKTTELAVLSLMSFLLCLEKHCRKKVFYVVWGPGSTGAFSTTLVPLRDLLGVMIAQSWCEDMSAFTFHLFC